MHATKTFAVAEGGLVHSGDAGLIDRLRAMINFGFQGQRSATVPGLNAKLPEVLALMARAKLEEIEAVCESRAAVEAASREALGDRFILPAPLGTRRATGRASCGGWVCQDVLIPVVTRQLKKKQK